MKRKDKEIKNKIEIEKILQKAKICRVGFSNNNEPYIVPLNFGYGANELFFHCAKEGKKIEMLKKNNKVCFEVDINNIIHNMDIPCEWYSTYRSVIGHGKAFIIDDIKEKRKALDVLVKHYSPKTNYHFLEKNVNNTCVFKIQINEMTGKRSEPEK